MSPPDRVYLLDVVQRHYPAWQYVIVDTLPEKTLHITRHGCRDRLA